MEERIVGAHARANKDHARGVVVLGYVVEKMIMILATVATDLSAATIHTFVFSLYLLKVISKHKNGFIYIYIYTIIAGNDYIFTYILFFICRIYNIH